jgi:hypothetical protein
LPAELVTALSRHLRLTGDPHEALRARFGARPKADFVGETWPVLLETWLAQSPATAASVADRLRARGVGDASKTDAIEYLKSCRNAIGLREAVVVEFVDLGEQSQDHQAALPEVESPGGSRSRPPRGNPGSELVGRNRVPSADDESSRDAAHQEDTPAPPAEGVAHFTAWVDECLKRFLEVDELHRDEDGDVVIPHGSTVVYARTHDRPLRLELFALLVRDIGSSPDLLATLNGINGALNFEKVHYVEQAKLVELNVQVMADGISERALVEHLRSCAVNADHFDSKIKERFGGQTMLRERRKDERIV